MAQFPSIINSGSFAFAPKDVSPTGQGELFFLTSNQRLYYICQCLTTWTAASSMNIGGQHIWGSGTQTAALAFGGYRPPLVPSPYYSACTEEYDGTSWTAGGGMIQARINHAGDGSQTATFAAGGYVPPAAINNTEEYDGSTWTAGGALITGRCDLGAAGTQNAGLTFAGGSPSNTTCTEEYDGASWSAGGALPTAFDQGGSAGTQNAGLSVGGSPVNTCVLHYDGAAWSAGTNIPAGSTSDMRVAGLQTAALAHAAGRCTQTYDGSAWTTVGFTGTNGSGGSTTGTTSAAVGFGGSPSPYYACTCEYATSNPIGGVAALVCFA